MNGEVCPVCGDQLPPQTGAGRRRVYCGVDCRQRAGARRARGVPIADPPTPEPRIRTTPVDDDEILDWWQDYANGIDVAAIALKYGRTRSRIMDEFIELGIPIRGEDFTERELGAMNALANVDFWRRSVEYARSMQHVKPMRRPYMPQSARQRQQDRAATGIWRSVIRRDLIREGLLPRRGRRV